MSHAPLVVSTFCFLLGFACTIFALRTRRYQPPRWNFAAIALGFVFQTVWLGQRGHAIGRCPLTNLFEVFIFLSWSMVLLYLLVGTAYRLSLLGAFTSPLVFLFQILRARLRPSTPRRPPRAARPIPGWNSTPRSPSSPTAPSPSPGVAGVMYLVQERQLKTHHIRPLFLHLPPIADLAVAMNRLLSPGFVPSHPRPARRVRGRAWTWMQGHLGRRRLADLRLIILQAEKWRRVIPAPRRAACRGRVQRHAATLWGAEFPGSPAQTRWMDILCLGLSHQTADVAAARKICLGRARARDACGQPRAPAGLSETVIISTCNRVELYAAARPSRARGFAALKRFLASSATPRLARAQALLPLQRMPACIRHLFRVVSGLESMVLGETEILGQVKKAYPRPPEAARPRAI